MSINSFKTEINENISLTQDARGLTFGTDAYLLSAFVKPQKKAVAADLGSGTGVIPLLCLSRNKAEKFFAIEIQESFASIIEQNAIQNKLGERLIPICSDLRSINAQSLGREVDIVTANPPYMKADSGKRNENDEKFIARHEVYGGIGDFCACAARILKHGGRFYTVWRPDRLVDLICALRDNKLEPKEIIFVYATPKNEPSMVLTRSVKGGSSGSVVTRPLFLHDSREDAVASILSQDAQAIYDTCSFEAFK